MYIGIFKGLYGYGDMQSLGCFRVCRCDLEIHGTW